MYLRRQSERVVLEVGAHAAPVEPIPAPADVHEHRRGGHMLLPCPDAALRCRCAGASASRSACPRHALCRTDLPHLPPAASVRVLRSASSDCRPGSDNRASDWSDRSVLAVAAGRCGRRRGDRAAGHRRRSRSTVHGPRNIRWSRCSELGRATVGATAVGILQIQQRRQDRHRSECEQQPQDQRLAAPRAASRTPRVPRRRLRAGACAGARPRGRADGRRQR